MPPDFTNSKYMGGSLKSEGFGDGSFPASDCVQGGSLKSEGFGDGLKFECGSS
jgi:hypothetical protein